MGIILTFTTTFFIFSGIATSATNQNNPLFDSVYNINTYNNPNAISGSDNIVNIGNGNNNNNNTNTRGTGDRLEDYNITDNQLDEFLNNVDENGNLKGSANYNPLPVNNNSNVNNINNNNSNKNNPSPNINNNTTNTTRNNTTNNNSNINTANKRIDIINRYPCTALRWFLKYGYNNHEVRALQVFLFKEGYMTVLPNGNFGPATRAAVLAFQKENNIDTKGYVGPNTRARVALDTCNNVNAYSNNSGNNNSDKNNSNFNNNSSNNGSANSNSNNSGSGNNNSFNNNFTPINSSFSNNSPIGISNIPISNNSNNIIPINNLTPNDNTKYIDSNIGTINTTITKSITTDVDSNKKIINVPLIVFGLDYASISIPNRNISICIDPSSSSVTVQQVVDPKKCSEYDKLTDVVVGEDYDALYDKSSKKWAISIYYDARWIKGGYVYILDNNTNSYSIYQLVYDTRLYVK